MQRRQHPTDPNFFWCPKCKTYKARQEFYKNVKAFNAIDSRCKKCAIEYQVKRNRILYQANEQHRRWRIEKVTNWGKENKTRYRENNNKACALYRSRGKHKVPAREYGRRQVATLGDTYVKGVLRAEGLIVTTDMIELKRQSLLMKRTLGEFKEWRKKHEPEHERMDGEQRDNKATVQGD